MKKINKDSGGENEPLECHSENMGVDSSEDNSKSFESIIEKLKESFIMNKF